MGRMDTATINALRRTVRRFADRLTGRSGLVAILAVISLVGGFLLGPAVSNRFRSEQPTSASTGRALTAELSNTTTTSGIPLASPAELTERPGTTIEITPNETTTTQAASEAPTTDTPTTQPNTSTTQIDATTLPTQPAPTTELTTTTSVPTSPSTTASLAAITRASDDDTTNLEGAGPCLQQTFRDDFNGDQLGDHWVIYDTPGNHSPHAIRRQETVSIQGGALVITAHNDDSGTLISGGMRHSQPQKYGTYSFRVRTDADPTNATSGVILTWPVSNNQPRDGENNFYETLTAPGSRWPFYGFVHEPFDDRADGVAQKRFVFEADATQWQEITAEWTPNYISITRTGPGSTTTETHRLDEGANDRITDASHFFAIQLDQFKDSLPQGREVKMEVDWVEISSYCG